MNKKIFILFSLMTLFFQGCSTKMFDSSNQIEEKKIQNIKISNKNTYTDLEKELVEIAKESKRNYNEYIEILSSLKDKTKMYDNTKIPKRLARRTSFHYEGPALRLLQKVAEETMYSFDYSKYRVYDSKNIVRNYTDTMLIDIIYDITSELNFDVIINEKDSKIELKER